jgi:hypothetical protein
MEVRVVTLFDGPESSSMRVLVVAIAAPEARFERAEEVAAPGRRVDRVPRSLTTTGSLVKRWATTTPIPKETR